MVEARPRPAPKCPPCHTFRVLQAVKALASELGAQVVEASKHDLNMVTDNRPHQASGHGRARVGVGRSAQCGELVGMHARLWV